MDLDVLVDAIDYVESNPPPDPSQSTTPLTETGRQIVSSIQLLTHMDDVGDMENSMAAPLEKPITRGWSFGFFGNKRSGLTRILLQTYEEFASAGLRVAAVCHPLNAYGYDAGMATRDGVYSLEPDQVIVTELLRPVAIELLLYDIILVSARLEKQGYTPRRIFRPTEAT